MRDALQPPPLLLVFAAFGAGALLHIDRVPPWCAAAALLALAWRYAQLRGWFALPPRALRIALALALTFATLATYRTLSGLAAGSALLLAMGAVKLLETRQRRDAIVVVLVSLVLLLAACLDRQSLPRLPLYAATGWLGCAAIAALGSSAAGRSARVALRSAGTALLWGLPLALVFFVFVPRLPGALWSLPGSNQAQTGLGDEMSPGSISELAVSSDPAFRVRFESAAPPPEQRYWRGPVLHSFDGYTWSRGPGGGVRQREEPLGEPIRYQVILEPSGRNWWFGLDSVDSVSRRGVFRTWDGQLVATRPVTAPLVYDAQSHLQVRSYGPLAITTRRVDTRLPPGRNPKTQAFATRLRSSVADERAYVQAAIAHFRDGGFEYTLTPPLLDYDSVDGLLFNTRLGFCGHFASAFVTLMRAANLPARVVTGYLGGEWNPLGGYLLVRQSDAHAWAEVWLEDEGWVRVDPTAVVSPSRLQRGLGDLMPGSFSAAQRFANDSPLLRDLLAAWDATNHWWQERVLNFNLSAQQDLLSRIGLHDFDYGKLVWLLLGGSLLWAGIVGLWLARGSRSLPPDPVGALWHRLRAQARAGGLPIAAHEPPRAVARRIAAGWPELAGQIESFASLYLQLRYAPASTAAADPDELARQWKSLRRGLGRHRAIDPYTDLAGRVPLYSRLPPNLRARAARLAGSFEQRVHFEGCGGLVLTPFMRRSIAFQACVPILNRGAGLYAGLRAVLVYPDEFVVTQEVEDETGVVTRGTDVLSGQTEDTSRVLLSWTDIEQGFRQDNGYNVVLHEFAHVIDHTLDGRLTRRDGAADADWHDVLHAEYTALCAQVEAGEASLIDPYGAEDPAEFFAVSTEAFFGQSGALRARHPGLYRALARLYQLDPAEWEA